MELSIVSPVYKSRESIPELTQSIAQLLEQENISYEIILVDDGCPEDSWQVIEEVCLANSLIKGIRLSRNFGQHKAITAGLKQTSGHNVIVMDCDLQDGPEYLLELLNESKKGFDIVYTKKEKREHNKFKNITSLFFQKIFNWLTNDGAREYDTGVGTFSLITRKAVDAFLSVNDCHRHYLMILRWLGFKSSIINIKHRTRKYGQSSYSLSKLLEHALDGITSQSNTLLYFSLKLGLFFFILSILGVVLVVTMYFLYGFKEGWSSIIVSILLSTSAILLSLGANGIYLGKVFDQSKDRPLYIIDKRLN